MIRETLAFLILMGVLIFGLALRDAMPHGLPGCKASPDIWHDCDPRH